jgi:hypothetical protein
LKSIVTYITVIISVFLLFGSCKKQVKYSKIPAIEFESIRVVRNQLNPLSYVYGDSVIVNIKYQDGDGDLGLANLDTSAADDNYIMNVYKQINGVFSPLIFDPSFNGKFPKLTTDNSVGPIDGVLSRSVFMEYSAPLVAYNDTLIFEITIYDRAGNESNTIRTPSVVVDMYP